MMDLWRIVATISWAAGIAVRTAPAQSPERVAAAVDRGLAIASGDSLWPSVQRFYAGREFRPVWIAGGKLVAGVRDLRRALADARGAGLEPSDYPLSSVDALIAMPEDSDSLAVLDITATYALYRYASDITLGRIAPGLVDTMWSASPRRPNASTLVEAVVSGGGRQGRALASLGPAQLPAIRLQRALATYQRIAGRGGWPVIPAGFSLALGAHGPRVTLLQQRLRITGDLETVDSSGTFDSVTDSGLKRFQRRHGLDPDGVVGPLTRAALNVPARVRVRQLAMNLERWRWLPRDLGRRYLMINSAAYTLTLVDTAGIADTFAVIVGRKDWPTPIVSAALTELVFNPRWNIPRSIALAEVVPAELHDSTYVTRQHIHVLSDTTDPARELEPDSVNWGSITDSTFALRLWMEPGPGNPLGRIRLAVPNRFNVALHDTPDTALFAEPARTFSHGCVRVAGIPRLATTLALMLADWPADSVQTAIASPEERHLRFPRSMPVHFVYWTAWVDPDDTVQFRPDGYGWDARLEQAIQARSFPRSADARP